MERLLIVNADDFGLSKGRNYGIIEALSQWDCHIDDGAGEWQAIDHAVQLSRDEPSLAIGMHFVPYYGQTTDSYAGVNPRWCAGKWICSWQKKMLYRWKKLLRSLPVSICVSLSYLDANLRILIAIIMHMFPQIFPIVAGFAAEEGLRCASTVSRYLTLVIYRLICAVLRGFSSAFYGEEISEALFLQVLDDANSSG